MTQQHRTLAQIEEDLIRATKAHEDAKTRAQMASRDARGALNDLNAIQKEFDAAVGALKKNADEETDWREQARRRGIPV